MQDKIFKVKNFEVTHKSVKVFSLEIFRLYGNTPVTCAGAFNREIDKRVACKLVW